MKKIIFTSIVLCTAMISCALADDCNILTDIDHTLPIDKHIESLVGVYGTAYEAVLPAESFKRALINLKAYCCSQAFGEYCSVDDKNNTSSAYPKSAFLFDHLLDVAMRRLDGIT